MAKKDEHPTEKFRMPQRQWEVTAINGEKKVIDAFGYGDMIIQAGEWLETMGLAVPLGIMQSGIKEVKES